MSRYLIYFKPLTPYFFGGEQTFGDGENVNYFAKSNVFPQQTTILGTLRKEVLIQKGLFKENFSDYTDDKKIRMNELIGNQSYNIKSPFKFGVIKSISPLFIAESDNTYYINIPKDFGLNFKINRKLKSWLDRERAFSPHLSNYNPKDGLSSDFLSANKKVSKRFDEIFSEQIRIGITKDRIEEDKEKLFKQLRYYLHNEYSFATIVNFANDFGLKDSIVYMGADNSVFEMKVQTFEKSFGELFKSFQEDGKVILLSDAFIEEDIYQHCEFAVTEIIDFRNFQYSNGNYKFSKDKSKSNKHTFFKRGSVFFTKKREELSSILNGDESLKKIGYNHFI